jgi:hypothetical protein
VDGIQYNVDVGWMNGMFFGSDQSHDLAAHDKHHIEHILYFRVRNQGFRRSFAQALTYLKAMEGGHAHR